MTIRYFNLKKGSPTVNGGLIEVDTSRGDLEKLADFNGDFASSPWKFKSLGREGKDEIYEVALPNETILNSPGRDTLGGRIGVPLPVPNGQPRVVKLKLSKSGELTLYQLLEGIYLSEIPEKKAKEMRQDAFLWASQRAYICE